MDVTFTLANPTGCRHWRLVVGLPGGRQRVVHFDRVDLGLEPEEKDELWLALARHLARQAGATTLAQAKAALEGRTFKV